MSDIKVYDQIRTTKERHGYMKSSLGKLNSSLTNREQLLMSVYCDHNSSRNADTF